MKIKAKSVVAIVAGVLCAGVSQAALVAEWNFDGQTMENSGTTAGEHDGFVASGSGTNMVIQSASYTTDTPSGSGYALDLSSIYDYMVITNSATNFFGYVDTFDTVTDFSYSMWVKSPSGSWNQWAEFGSKGLENYAGGFEGAGGWGLRAKYAATEGVIASLYPSESTQDADPTIVIDGAWHLLTLTYDSAAGDLSLYVDGEWKSTATGTTMTHTPGRMLLFDTREEDVGKQPNCYYDSIQFYDNALSSNDVAALYIEQTSFFTDVDEISLELIQPATTVTGSIAVSYLSSTDIDVDVSLSNATHVGAFNVLTSVPFTMTEPAPSNTPIEVVFDLAVAGSMTNGEIASCTAVIAWNKDGDAEVTLVEVPVTVEYKESVPVGTPVLWDISKSSDGNDIPSIYADFVAAGVTEHIEGADVSNIDGAQNMTDGFITVDLSAFTGANINGTTYSGDGASIMKEYIYLKNADADITIGGLSDRLAADEEYSLYLWGKGDGVDQVSVFTYNSETITTATNDVFVSDATNFMAKFSFTTDAIVADTLVVNWARGAGQTYTGLNGFAIVPKYALNPTVGEISIEIISGGTEAVLTFETVNGAFYGVAAKSLLTTSGWTPIASGIDGTGGDVSVTNALGAGPQFYRAYIED